MIALIDAGEPDHDRCRNALQRPELPLVTTWPAFTDGIYLLGQAAWAAEAALWKMVQRDVLTLAELDRELMLRWVQLMERYRDHPMDLADAPLVALAGARDLRTILTRDDDFGSYRLSSWCYLDVVPTSSMR